MRSLDSILTALIPLVLGGCASMQEVEVRRAFTKTPAPKFGVDSSSKSAGRAEQIDARPVQDLAGYKASALEHHPRLEASFEAWRQAILQVSSTKKLPAPTLTFGAFLLSVETRVGPQLGRVGLMQAFPWPGTLFAGADAATAKARTAQHEFEAEALSVIESVALAYWTLWEVRQAKRVHREHLVIMRGIADAVRTRLVTGMASLADVQQIDLNISRLEDLVTGMDEKEAIAASQLRNAVGLDYNAVVPTPRQTFGLRSPAHSDEELREWARAHPSLRSWDSRAEMSDAKAAVAESKLYPSFSVGADWVLTGPSTVAGVADGGKDAVMLGGGISIPVWNWLLDDDVAAARAGARTLRAMRAGGELNIDNRLAQTLARIRDSHRRGALYSSVLIPQAEATTEAILGGFSTGRSTVAQALLAQRDVLELRILRDAAIAQNARAWAQLENLVGRDVDESNQTIEASAKQFEGMGGSSTLAPSTQTPKEEQ